MLLKLLLRRCKEVIIEVLTVFVTIKQRSSLTQWFVAAIGELAMVVLAT